MAPTSSSSFRRSRPSSRKDVAANNLSRSNNPTTAIGSPSILSAAAQHQYVWVSTDLMEAVLKSGDPLATNWEPVTRNRATALEWGWCRAVVLSSSITNNRTPSATSTATPWTEDRKNLPTNNEKPTTVSPFGNYTLRKCVISPPKPSNTAAGSNCPAISTLPWDTASPTKRPVVKPTTTTVAMTVRVDDAEFAPDSLQGRTVSFSYATTTTTPTSNNKGAAVTDEQRVCLANDWWTREYECDDDNNNNATEPTNEPPTDLTALEQLHEPAVVYCLLRRYQKNQIYTYTGKILLALNPFAQLPHLYGEEVMWEYCSKTQQQQDRSPRNSPEKDQPQQKRRRSSRPPPHVYAVAEDAYRSAMDSIQNNTSVAASRAFAGGNQSILVSGESGAGKTVTTKIILQYLAVLSQKADTSAAVVTGIESQVLESNPILESFGNARTVRNDNSSRFGKFLEMQFEATGCLVEASIQTYLLEKVRLISQAPGERNYHIFYEMLSGLSAQERRALHMSGRSVNDFCMTSMSGTIDRRDGVKDCDTFQELRTACDTVGFSRSEQSDLFTVACALLYTSNLTFVEDSVDGSTLDSTNPSLRFALDLLGVDASVLNNALCTCAIEARGETLYKCLSIDRAEKATEALIKATYSALFAYIVRRINCFISNRQDRPVSMVNGLKPRIASIGVLDIFGFESFERNSFEQLCINFCNEALQQQFNRFVFKLEQEEYHREGIDWSFISFPDNQDVLDLIEKRHDGILSVLDEQSRLPQCTDATFASAIYQKCIVHPRFGATKAMQAQLSFAVQHYAGLVEYDSECFLEKNKDELPKETTELLISSSYAFLAMLGKGLAGESQQLNQSSMSSRTPQKGHKQLHRSSSLLRESVGTQFCSQLKVLRTRIESTTPHYVRCLKPNDDLLPHKFDALVIADQLRCAGVLEAVRVSRVGFSNRYYHENFVSRFSLLEPTSIAKHKQKKLKGRELCCILVDLLSPKLIQSLELSNEDLSLSIGG